MPKQYNVLPGTRFGMLTVVSEVERGPLPYRIRNYLCRCECGGSVVAKGIRLRGGHIKSCGCLSIATASKIHTKHGHCANGSSTKEYKTWRAMRRRCEPTFKHHADYFDRGIRVCDRWQSSFEAFLEDVGPKPASHLTLDRYPNNDGNYEPGNIRWATRSQQQANRRRPKRHARTSPGGQTV